LPHGKEAGKGGLGVPEITLLPDSALEVRLPYQGKPGSETHFLPHEAGMKTKAKALSVDLHGKWRLERSINRVLKEGAICRVQIYTHPDRVRVSAVACDQAANGTFGVSAEHSDTHIRLLFTLTSPGKNANGKTSPF
jgi:hypothetical protein